MHGERRPCRTRHPFDRPAGALRDDDVEDDREQRSEVREEAGGAGSGPAARRTHVHRLAPTPVSAGRDAIDPSGRRGGRTVSGGQRPDTAAVPQDPLAQAALPAPAVAQPRRLPGRRPAAGAGQPAAAAAAGGRPARGPGATAPGDGAALGGELAFLRGDGRAELALHDADRAGPLELPFAIVPCIPVVAATSPIVNPSGYGASSSTAPSVTIRKLRNITESSPQTSVVTPVSSRKTTEPEADAWPPPGQAADMATSPAYRIAAQPKGP